MARKYDLISELYRRTAHAVVSDVQNWQAFLRCACRNYRLRFDEQLLIYAQRPDATAVLNPLLRYFRYPRKPLLPPRPDLGDEAGIYGRCDRIP